MKQNSGLELFQEIVADFQRASKKSRSIEAGQEEKDDDDAQNQDSAGPTEISCCLCRAKIEHGSFVASMACCGANAHVHCLAAGKKTDKCPACNEQLNEVQVQTCLALVEAVPPGGSYRC